MAKTKDKIPVKQKVYNLLLANYGTGYTTPEVSSVLRLDIQAVRNAMFTLVSNRSVYKVPHKRGSFKFFAKDPKAPFSNVDNTYNNMDYLSIFGKSKASITKKDRIYIRAYKFFN
tara:strand:- start:160 stop:504 length:345 start_codon:yes stop_codon:yes gene_type:complete